MIKILFFIKVIPFVNLYQSKGYISEILIIGLYSQLKAMLIRETTCGRYDIR